MALPACEIRTRHDRELSAFFHARCYSTQQKLIPMRLHVSSTVRLGSVAEIILVSLLSVDLEKNSVAMHVQYNRSIFACELFQVLTT